MDRTTDPTTENDRSGWWRSGPIEAVLWEGVWILFAVYVFLATIYAGAAALLLSVKRIASRVRLSLLPR